jgi:ribA/ribD-fused uncharacterized protein
MQSTQSMDDYMNKCSYFIEGLALFGSSPTQEFVDYLEDELGIRYFVDLTYDNERNIDAYTTTYTKIRYPIKDQKIPTNQLEFCKLIYRLCDIVKSGGKMYLHCKGGHGRSGVVVAAVLGVYHDVGAEEALAMTYKFHQNRKVMRDRWRMIGSPQTYAQKEFIRQLFYPIYYNTYGNVEYKYLSTFSKHCVSCRGFGSNIDRVLTFPTAEAAYQAYKNPGNLEYVLNQTIASTPKISKELGKMVKLRPDWDNVKESIMINVITAKFEQHTDIRELLIDTGLRIIIKCSKRTSFWNLSSENRMGKLMMNVRKIFSSSTCPKVLDMGI